MAPRIILITFLLVDYHVNNRIPFIDQNCGRKLPHENNLRQFFTTRNNCAASTRRMVRYVWYPVRPNEARASVRPPQRLNDGGPRGPMPKSQQQKAPRANKTRGAHGAATGRAGYARGIRSAPRYSRHSGHPGGKVHPGPKAHPRPKCTRATRDTRGQSAPGAPGQPGTPEAKVCPEPTAHPGNPGHPGRTGHPSACAGDKCYLRRLFEKTPTMAANTPEPATAAVATNEASPVWTNVPPAGLPGAGLPGTVVPDAP